MIGAKRLDGLLLRHEPPVLDAQLRPRDADRVGGVVQVEALAPLAAHERILLMLADKAVHGARGRLALDQVRLPAPQRAGIADTRARVLRGAIDRVRQLAGSEANRHWICSVACNSGGNHPLYTAQSTAHDPFGPNIARLMATLNYAPAGVQNASGSVRKRPSSN